MFRKLSVCVSILLGLLALGVAPALANDGTLTVQRSEDRMSATAAWTPSPGAERQEFISVGTLLPGEDDPYGFGLHFASWKKRELAGSQSSLVISELEPLREYIYGVRSAKTDDAGNLVWSAWDRVGLPSPPSDRDALVALYNATDGDNWRKSDNWLTDAPIGEWHGVETDADGRVVALDLWLNDLEGQLPPELGDLDKLKRLNLWLNGLSGDLPSELGALSELEELLLIGNRLTGAIPPELGNLSNLRKLYLSVGNQFTGCIPAALEDVPSNDLSSLALPFCE